MTVPGISHSLAAAIVRLRGNLGYLRRLANLESVPGMTADVMARLQSMMERAERFGGYVREWAKRWLSFGKAETARALPRTAPHRPPIWSAVR
jgi:hypothetical protein